MEEVKQEQKIPKLLLLGPGGSGKSTIFKQMQIIYDDGFSNMQKTTFITVVRRNIVESMQTLIEGAEEFKYNLTLENQETATHIAELDPLGVEFWSDDIVDRLKKLWLDEGIQKTLKYRARLNLLDSTNYLFANIDRIGQSKYVPSEEDILRARLRTCGIVEKKVNLHGVDFKFLDVGGQRNERRKWLHCFNQVTAVIFVAAINEYDQTLYEDDETNRFQEALDVFEKICNNKIFENTPMLLFLNKTDLLQEKLKSENNGFQKSFPDFNGDDTKFEECAQYLEDLFLSKKKNPTPDKKVFTYRTCATDTQNVEKVFVTCKTIILNASLQSIGMNAL